MQPKTYDILTKHRHLSSQLPCAFLYACSGASGVADFIVVVAVVVVVCQLPLCACVCVCAEPTTIPSHVPYRTEWKCFKNICSQQFRCIAFYPRSICFLIFCLHFSSFRLHIVRRNKCILPRLRREVAYFPSLMRFSYATRACVCVCAHAKCMEPTTTPPAMSTICLSTAKNWWSNQTETNKQTKCDSSMPAFTKKWLKSCEEVAA